MSLVTAGLRLAVLALPPVLRRRYHEEWSADLAGARQLGLSPAAVLVGAFGTVLSIDRTDPRLTGLPRAELRRRRGRWAAALLTAAVLLSADLYLRGDNWVIGAIRTVLVAAGLLAGGSMLAGMLRIPYDRPAAPRPARRAGPIPASTRWGLGAGFALAALAAVTVGVLHIAVWNPLAKVPGATLDEIYAAMSVGDEVTVRVWLILWGVLAVGASIAYPVVCVLSNHWPALTRRHLVVSGLGLLGGVITAGGFPTFAMGMALADTFTIDGGDAAPTGPALAMIGQLALTGGLLLGLAPPAIPRRRTA
jgi:hypothetical protein